MGEVLKVCRLGTDWAVKDSHGTYMCRSPKLDEVKTYAERWAKRIGGRYIVRDEQGVKRG